MYNLNWTKGLMIAVLLLQMAGLRAQENVRIISYNVLYGFQQDTAVVNRYLSFINKWQPSIVGLQEMNGYTQKKVEALAAQYGHHYALQCKEDGFPVALSSRYPLVNFKKVTENMTHGFIYSNVKGLHVFVIHFDPHKVKKRLTEVQTIVAHAAALPKGEPIVIMGDFNSYDRADGAYYTPEVQQSMREREQITPSVRNLLNNEIDYSVMQTLKDAGFQDSYWLTNKASTSSIPTFKDGKGNVRSSASGAPKRIDYIWVNAAAAKKVIKSGVIKDEYSHYISDHYPTFIDLKLR